MQLFLIASQVVLHSPLYFKVIWPESLLLTALYWERDNKCVTSGFRHVVNEICTLLRFYAMQNGSLIPTFRDNLIVSSSSVNDNKAMFSRLLFYTTQYLLPQLWEHMCWQQIKIVSMTINTSFLLPSNCSINSLIFAKFSMNVTPAGVT
jgi:hypothetical protein